MFFVFGDHGMTSTGMLLYIFKYNFYNSTNKLIFNNNNNIKKT